MFIFQIKHCVMYYMHRKDILFKEVDLYLSCGTTWLLYSTLLSFSPFWWKVKGSSTDRVSMPNKPFYLKCPLWGWQIFEPVFLSSVPMTSVRLRNIWACTSVISSLSDFSSWNHLNYLGFVLCTGISLLLSSCQTLVNFCIRSSVKDFDLFSWYPDPALEIHRRRGLKIKILHLWTGSGNHAKSLKFTRLLDYNVISPLEVLLYVFFFNSCLWYFCFVSH